jgi:hypothetical protein
MRTGVLSDRSVIDNCPVFKPIPMKDIAKLKVFEPTHDFAGIKSAVHAVPARPVTLHAMQIALQQARSGQSTPAQAPTQVAEETASIPAGSQMDSNFRTPPRRHREYTSNRDRGTPAQQRERAMPREVNYRQSRHQGGTAAFMGLPVAEAAGQPSPFNPINEFQYFARENRDNERQSRADRSRHPHGGW